MAEAKVKSLWLWGAKEGMSSETLTIWLLVGNREIGWACLRPEVWQAVLKQIEERMDEQANGPR